MGSQWSPREFLDNENVDLSCIEITDNQTYANRLWKPEDCAPDMYEDYDLMKMVVLQ